MPNCERVTTQPHQGLSWSNPSHPLMVQQVCLYWGHPPHLQGYSSLQGHLHSTHPPPPKGVVRDTRSGGSGAEGKACT